MTNPLDGTSVPFGSSRRLYLSILFADLSDSTRLGASIEAEHYAELLSGLRKAAREVVERHGGKIARLQGDGVLAIFGQPQPSEDDGRRATEAALDLHAAARRLRVEGVPPGSLALHSGVHAGLVLVEDGDVELGRFELLGNAPNVAARLSAAAGFDQILVSEETLGPKAHLFQTGERQLLALKGCPQPVAAYCVTGRAPVRGNFQARSVPGLAPYVGREAEMLALEAHLQRAAAGTPVLVAVTAGAGMGKTRFIEEFLHRPAAAACVVHRGYCENLLSATPLQPFLQILRALFGLLHGMSPAEAAASARAALARLGPGLERHRAELLRSVSLPANGDAPAAEPAGMTAVLRELFDTLATRPLLLVIDDWQWADDASQQALSAILGLRRPILVLLGSRGLSDADPLRWRAATVELAPLTLEETGRTVERLLPGAARFVSERIHGQAGGNPLFIEELCHSAAAEGAGRWRARQPHNAAWLSASIESRVARLPPAQAEVVRAAAVLGNVFPAWLLERISGHGAADPLLAELAEQDFIFPADQAGNLRFKHGIAREAIYDAVGLHQRRALHLRVAGELAGHGAALAEQDNYEALAYHFGAGGSYAEAARYSELAGDKAIAASALDRARSQYCAALDALDKLGLEGTGAKRHWSAVVQKLGVPCVYDPLGIDDALELFRRGAELARESGDAATQARALYWLGYVCYAKGRAREAQLHCEAALALAERLDDDRLAAQVRATLGQVLASACDSTRALKLLDQAIDAKRQRARSSRSVAAGSAYSLSCKGLLLGERGEFGAAHECFAEALQLVGGSEHQVESSVRGWQSTVLQWQGRWEEAAAVADEAARIAELVRSSHLYAMTRALAGYARWALRREPQALLAVQDATAWIEARHGLLFSSLNHGWLVDGLVSLGQDEAARHHAARAFARAREADRLGETMTCRGMAKSAARAGDARRARRYLELALRSARERGSPPERAASQLCAAEVALLLERPGEAGAPLDAASTTFAALQMHWHLQQAEQLRQRLA